MVDKIKAFLRENSLCVLATCAENRPHCSLMAYVVDSRDILYMATLTTTRKYANIVQNPLVSVLVDNRNRSPETQQNQALTVSGYCTLTEDPAIRSDMLSRIIRKHLHLQALVDLPDVAVIAVCPTAFLFMDGALKSHYVQLNGCIDGNGQALGNDQRIDIDCLNL